MRKRLIALLLVLGMLAGTGVATAESSKLVMWSWLDSYILNVMDEFHAEHPEIEIELVPVQAADYTKKIQSSLASGSQLPDIAWMDISLRGKLYSMNIWENLDAEPYNLDRSLIPSWLFPFIENDQGQALSITWDTGIAGIAYKRDLAKEYFGTDDPKELEALMPDWETFIQKGVEVNEKSGGKVKMFSALDEVMTLVANQNSVPFAADDTANIKETLGEAIDVGVRFRDADIVGKLAMWSPAWNADYALEETIFHLCAEWAPGSVIRPNDPDGEGNWGLMVPPGGCINQGGTSFAIPTGAQNKEAAWTFMQWLLLSKEGAEATKAKNSGRAHLTIMGDDYYENLDPYFGGQNIGQFYYKDALPGISVRPVGRYDLEFMQITTLVAQALMQDTTLTAEVALEKAEQEAAALLQ